MKKYLLPFVLLLCCPFVSCDKEDGDISEWVGTYHWSVNYHEDWSYVLGESACTKHEDYPMEKDLDFLIQDDKTWHIPDPKGPGKSGQIKCYKDHINLLDLLLDYRIDSSFAFSYVKEERSDFIKYEKNTNPYVGDHYTYEIRRVAFIKVQ